MDDAQLLRLYAEEGSEAAFSELVGRYFNLVHSAAVRRMGGDMDRAKDVTQLVFIDMARKAAVLSRHPVLVGWLYISTHFSAKKVIRGKQRRRKWEKEAQTMNEILSGPPAALALMLETHAVVAAPAGLAETVTASALASAAIPLSQEPSLFKILGKARLA